jgi:hypothetical protein
MGQSQKEKKKEIQMNAEQYKELKEMVISMDNTKLYNLFEILVDEINYRKLKVDTEQISQNGSGKI